MTSRAFRLPELDEAFLDTLGLTWDTVEEGGVQWLLLRGYRLPPGYDQVIVDVAIQISAGYPAAALDMAYLSPPVRRLDARPIAQTDGRNTIEGRVWQMWSRHRTHENPWIHGEDDLSSHVHYMDAWLAAEFERA